MVIQRRRQHCKVRLRRSWVLLAVRNKQILRVRGCKRFQRLRELERRRLKTQNEGMKSEGLVAKVKQTMIDKKRT
jgi:hypothetical protein